MLALRPFCSSALANRTLTVGDQEKQNQPRKPVMRKGKETAAQVREQ